MGTGRSNLVCHLSRRRLTLSRYPAVRSKACPWFKVEEGSWSGLAIDVATGLPTVWGFRPGSPIAEAIPKRKSHRQLCDRHRGRGWWVEEGHWTHAWLNIIIEIDDKYQMGRGYDSTRVMGVLVAVDSNRWGGNDNYAFCHIITFFVREEMIAFLVWSFPIILSSFDWFCISGTLPIHGVLQYAMLYAEYLCIKG